jgi:hypothetical protein
MILDFELIMPLPANTGYIWTDTAATADILTHIAA